MSLPHGPLVPTAIKKRFTYLLKIVFTSLVTDAPTGCEHGASVCLAEARGIEMKAASVVDSKATVQYTKHAEITVTVNTLLVPTTKWFSHNGPTVLVKVYLYSAFIVVPQSHSRRSGTYRTVFTCELHHTCLYLVSIHQMAPPRLT